MKKENDYCIIWINKNNEQIFDVVNHKNSDDALDIIFNDDDWCKTISQIIWMGKYPLNKSQMKERKKLTGMEIT